jgi:hypothetical protein
MIKDSYGNTRFFGVYRGIVSNVQDPLSKNRVKVQVPQILANNETQWAWPVGFVSSIPKPGQGVWVQFEGGDPSYPIWHGSFTDNLASTISTATTSSSTIDGGSA